MRKVYLVLFALVICGYSSRLSAQNIFSGFEHLFNPVQYYMVFRSDSVIIIDGKADDPAWNHAEWTEEFIDIEGTEKPKPKYKTRIKMLWDERYLYILAELEEPHVWAYYEKHDLIVFEENDFEVFIDPDGDSHNYFEIEINAQNTIFDLFMAKP
ncbi:MAG: carbohydrate-binding family 9-like protein, partial [Draconibacterium sp.]|nr:carbohydrate-binding family 9-like protein [Draconibacterium sp.]